MRFLLRRFLQAALVLISVSLLSFVSLELAPGDFLDEMRLNPRVSAETLDALRARYGLDRPFLERYALWARAVLQGSWGFSFSYGTEVGPLVWQRVANSLILSVSAMLLAWILAVPLGVLWAVRDAPGLGLLTSVVVAVPEVVAALGLLVVAERTRWFPVGGMRSLAAKDLSVYESFGDLSWHLVLPVTALALPAGAVLSRHVRSAVSEVLDQPFVQNAKALGLAPKRILTQYVLRPAASPLIALASLSIASLFSGSLVVEVVMGWPGLGPFLLEAILARDVHVVIAGVMCTALVVVSGGLFADLALYLNDPRIVRR